MPVEHQTSRPFRDAARIEGRQSYIEPQTPGRKSCGFSDNAEPWHPADHIAAPPLVGASTIPEKLRPFSGLVDLCARASESPAVPLCPNSKHRALVTPSKRGRGSKLRIADELGEQTPVPRHTHMTRAQRLKRVFNIDVETCQACGGRARVIACIEDSLVIRKILTHLEKKAQAIVAPRLIPNSRALRSQIFSRVSAFCGNPAVHLRLANDRYGQEAVSQYP